jgi:hypothetical protein
MDGRPASRYNEAVWGGLDLEPPLGTERTGVKCVVLDEDVRWDDALPGLFSIREEEGRS